MSTTLFPEVCEVHATFQKAVEAQGGEIAESVDFENGVIVRARLSEIQHARPGDAMNPGVAMRCCGSQIEIHPYAYRQVCRNGAIFAQTTGSAAFHRVEWDRELGDKVLADIEEAVACCTSEDTRAEYFDQIRESALVPAGMDLLLTLMPLLPNMQEQSAGLISTILGEFHLANDRTGFGLMNAITATARETREPDVKWELEKLGAMVPARLEWAPTTDDRSATVFGTVAPDFMS